MFCKHDWELIIKTETPRYTLNELAASGIKCSEQLAEKLLTGVTGVLVKCKTCSDIKKEEMLGNEVTQ